MSITSSLSLTPNNVFGKIYNGLYLSMMEILFLKCLITCEICYVSSNNNDGDNNLGRVLSPIFFICL